MKYAELPRATGRAERPKPTPILLPGVDQPIPVVIWPTSAVEDQEARKHAIKRARECGAETTRGDLVYDTAEWAYVIHCTYRDADSAERAPFFDSLDEVQRLGSETLAYLFQLQQVWQEEASPTYKAPDTATLVDLIDKGNSDAGDVFFSQLSASLQLRSWRFMAGLLASSRAARSPTGSPGTERTSASLPAQSPPHGRPKRKGRAPVP